MEVDLMVEVVALMVGDMAEAMEEEDMVVVGGMEEALEVAQQLWSSKCPRFFTNRLLSEAILFRGSTCACHSCACEKGQINHCSKGYKSGGGGYGGGGYGKDYCYGSMEGEYCTCDFCKCKTGFGVLGGGIGAGGGIGHHGGELEMKEREHIYEYHATFQTGGGGYGGYSGGGGGGSYYGK